jgi:hypothetical protein
MPLLRVHKCWFGLQDESKIRDCRKGKFVYAMGATIGQMIKIKGEAKVHVTVMFFCFLRINAKY